MSGHILWYTDTEPVAEGIAGGLYGSQQFGGQNSIISGYSTPIILGGYLYFDSALAVATGSS